jgi:hypothetical protein
MKMNDTTSTIVKDKDPDMNRNLTREAVDKISADLVYPVSYLSASQSKTGKRVEGLHQLRGGDLTEKQIIELAVSGFFELVKPPEDSQPQNITFVPEEGKSKSHTETNTIVEQKDNTFEWALSRMKDGFPVYHDSFLKDFRKVKYMTIGRSNGIFEGKKMDAFVCQEGHPIQFSSFEIFISGGWHLYEGTIVKPIQAFTITILVTGDNIYPTQRDNLTESVERILKDLTTDYSVELVKPVVQTYLHQLVKPVVQTYPIDSQEAIEFIKKWNHEPWLLNGPERASLKTTQKNLLELTPEEIESLSDGYHSFKELYEHRFRLWIELCKGVAKDSFNEGLTTENPVWISSMHSDNSSYDGWFMLGCEKATGEQMTYHLPNRLWPECITFARLMAKAPEFDGHTSQDVLKRLELIHN